MSEDLNQSTTMPAVGGGDPDPAPTAPDFASMVPEGFSDKPWMKEIDSVDKLFTQFDNAQTMLGKKSMGVPQETAGEEEWNKFFDEAGRPKTADLYEFTETKGFDRNTELEKNVKELMFKAGLSTKQAKELQTGYDGLMMGMMGKAQEDQTAKDKVLNQEFETLTKKHFGERQEEALETSKKLLAKLAPAEFSEHIAALDNKSLVAMAVVLDAVNKKYISEDSIHGGDGGAGGISKEDMRAKAKEMIASKEFKDPFHANHDKVRKEAKELYIQIEKMK